MYGALTLSGGGSRGAQTLGALAFLQKAGCLEELDLVVGTSIGSVLGAVACLPNVDLTRVFRERISSFQYPYELNLRSLEKTYGVDSGGGIDLFIDVALGTDVAAMTLREFYTYSGKRLVICAANVCTHKAMYFDYETAPNVVLRKALAMSCAVPLLIAARRLEGHGVDLDGIYVDGAIADNFPLRHTAALAGSDARILGILVATQFCASTRPTNLVTFTQAVIDTALVSASNAHRGASFGSTHQIDILELWSDASTPSALDFSLSIEERETLFAGGRRLAATWLTAMIIRAEDEVPANESVDGASDGAGGDLTAAPGPSRVE